MTRSGVLKLAVTQWTLLIVATALLVVGLKAVQAPAALLLGPLAVGIAFG